MDHGSEPAGDEPPPQTKAAAPTGQTACSGSRPRRWGVRIALCLYAAIAAWIALPGGFLFIVAETWRGRLFGACLAALAVSPPFLLRRILGRPKSLRRWLAGVLLIGVESAPIPLLVALSPAESEPVGVGAESVFPGPLPYRRLSPWNWLPEIDQVKVGTYVAAAFDPIVDWEQARRIREISMPILRAAEEDPAFRRLPSSRNYAYAELWGGAFDSGHLYTYVPARAPGERLPAVLFLHGSIGNFKAYLWAWKEFADRHRYVIICPSFGSGNWYLPGGVEAVERAWAYAVNRLGVDPDRVVLAGLSNGGTGVSRTAARHPARYSGLIFLSAVLEVEILSGTEFTEGWRGRPILILHGAKDDRIAVGFAQQAFESLSAGGCRATLQTYAEEDHFLFFSSLEAVREEIARWLAP